MVITNLGEGCFRLQSGETSLLLDPSSNRLKADVVLKTVVDAGEVEPSLDVVSFPGEYEIKGIEIEGYDAGEESTEKLLKTVYSVTWEDIKFVFLGQIAAVPDTKAMERIGEPDVLILPVHKDHFLPPEEAAKLVKQLEPKVVIPSFADKKASADFAKALGQDTQPQEKFVFRKKDLVPDQTHVVILEGVA